MSRVFDLTFYEKKFKEMSPQKIFDSYIYEMPMKVIQAMYLKNKEFGILVLENINEILNRCKGFYTRDINIIYMRREVKESILSNFSLFISKLIDRAYFLEIFRENEEVKNNIELFCVKKDDDIKNVKIQYDLILTYMERHNFS